MRVPRSTSPFLPMTSSGATPSLPTPGKTGRPEIEGVVANREEQAEHVGAAHHGHDAVIDAQPLPRLLERR